jgi:hypothetical protein
VISRSSSLRARLRIAAWLPSFMCLPKAQSPGFNGDSQSLGCRPERLRWMRSRIAVTFDCTELKPTWRAPGRFLNDIE